MHKKKIYDYVVWYFAKGIVVFAVYKCIIRKCSRNKSVAFKRIMFHTPPNLFENFFFILCHNLFISNSDMKLHIQPSNNMNRFMKIT